MFFDIIVNDTKKNLSIYTVEAPYLGKAMTDLFETLPANTWVEASHPCGVTRYRPYDLTITNYNRDYEREAKRSGDLVAAHKYARDLAARRRARNLNPGDIHFIGPKDPSCGHCGGTGEYWVRSENFQNDGKYVPAMCYRCEGKGYQTQADERRNWGYDMNRPAYI